MASREPLSRALGSARLRMTMRVDRGCSVQRQLWDTPAAILVGSASAPFGESAVGSGDALASPVRLCVGTRVGESASMASASVGYAAVTSAPSSAVMVSTAVASVLVTGNPWSVPPVASGSEIKPVLVEGSSTVSDSTPATGSVDAWVASVMIEYCDPVSPAGGSCRSGSVVASLCCAGAKYSTATGS